MRITPHAVGPLLLAALIRIDPASAQSIYTPYTFATFAGQAGVAGTNDSGAGGARFGVPSAAAVDSAGIVYVSDSSNNTIRAITPMGVVTTLAGLAGSPGSSDGTGSVARFDLPLGVAVDSAGNLYIADCYNDTIRQVAPVGTNWVVTTLAGLAGCAGTNDATGSAARFFYPYGVAVDASGNVYVADTGNSTIRKMTLSGTNWVVTTFAGTPRVTGSADGTGSAALFDEPNSVALDGVGNIYVADNIFSTIRQVTPAGVVTTLAGLAGRTGAEDGTGNAARFLGPYGVAIDGGSNVFVADYGNSTIRKITPVGTNWFVTTLAGLPRSYTNADGTGSAARFNQPLGVAADTEGNVYVADSYNHTIRKGHPENVPAVIGNSAPQFGFTNGQFGFQLTGPAGQLVVVQVSTDLVSWSPIWTNTFAGVGTNYSTLTFSDPQGAIFSQCFYRALTP